MDAELGAAPDRFGEDITASLGAWRKAPLIPIVAAVLAAASSSTLLRPLAGNRSGAIGFAVGMFTTGWQGTHDWDSWSH